MAGLIPPDTVLTRRDLHSLRRRDIEKTARHLNMPHLPAFLSSIAAAQAAVPGGIVRAYLRDLLQRGWFEIVSPSTGQILRSGSSVVLTDKTVVFSFPEEPTLLLGIGDISVGYPICAALMANRKLLLGLSATLWGFSERHLPELSRVIDETGWRPGPATEPLCLVMGDSNFAHHAWNQLSALEELAQSKLPDRIRVVATHQPLGPINEIFPEIARWPVSYTADVGLAALNAPGALFGLVGSRFITTGLVRRLLAVAEARISPSCQAIREALAAVTGPVLWMSVRTRNRTATNQHAMLSALGQVFLQVAPHGAIIIDGYSLSADLSSYPSYHQDEADNVLAQDLAAAEALRQTLDAGDARGRVHVAVGLTISDSILLSGHASIYFCHHGTVQHKIGWFSSVPGVVHCNRAMLQASPSAWVAAQSEVAIPPLYLAPHLVKDADVTAGAYPEYGDLLSHANYTIVDIPAAITDFFTHAANANVAVTIAQEDLMRLIGAAVTSKQSANDATTSPPASVRPPNRHLMTPPESLIPSGTLYTDFFQFVDAQLQPTAYFEIGTHLGRSVKAFKCSAVCVDPHFMLDQDVLTGRPQTHFYQMSSDAFFAQHELRNIFKSGPDICFLDGMHRSEYLLRDFINTERQCHQRSIIFMHDCLPVNARMALRTHELGDPSEGHWQHAWTGDVWKVIPVLKEHRPDLKIFILDCAPTGLVAVAHLDPDSTVLANNYNHLVSELRELDLDTYTIRRLWSELPVISSRSLLEHPEDLTLFLDIH